MCHSPASASGVAGTIGVYRCHQFDLSLTLTQLFCQATGMSLFGHNLDLVTLLFLCLPKLPILLRDELQLVQTPTRLWVEAG